MKENLDAGFLHHPVQNILHRFQIEGNPILVRISLQTRHGRRSRVHGNEALKNFPRYAAKNDFFLVVIRPQPVHQPARGRASKAVSMFEQDRFRAALIAAPTPAGPPPHTTTSASSRIGISRDSSIRVFLEDVLPRLDSAAPTRADAPTKPALTATPAATATALLTNSRRVTSCAPAAGRGFVFDTDKDRGDFNLSFVFIVGCFLILGVDFKLTSTQSVLTQRNPKTIQPRSGASPPRWEQRAKLADLCHAPPRITRKP